MIADRLRVFVSSKMEELSAERAVVKAVLDELNVEAWIFEKDAGSRPETIQEAYKDELEAADLYIGIFWKGYGDYTVDEYEHAQKTQKDCLVYQKGGDNLEGRDPRLEAFLRRISHVETGITIQWFETADELAGMVKRDAARWQTRIVRESRDAAARGAGAGYGADPNLAVLARKVQQAWVDGVLDRSIAETGLIDVAKESRPDATQGGFEAVLELPDRGRSVVDAGTTPFQIYDQVQGSLLILGHPGSGKTTTALQITRELLRRSARDASVPVPVMLNLSAWTGNAPSLSAWIIKELSSMYQIPGRVSRTWLEQRRVVLVLDGLDEIAADLQAAFVESLNNFLEEYGSGGLVVAGGIDEYESLPVKLRTQGAINLQPLGPQQIDACLDHGGEALAGLREALKTDAALQELAKSPLMLNVMSLAYRNCAAEELEADTSDSTDVRRAQIFKTYVDRSFERRGRRGSFSREAMTAWLSWIARRMTQRNQTMFLVENLQPSWLAGRAHLAAYLVGVAIFMSALFGAMCIVFRATPQKTESAHPLDNLEEAAAWIFGLLIWYLAIGFVDSLRSRSRAGDTLADWRGSLRRILLNFAIYGTLSVPLLYVVSRGQGDAASELGNWLMPVVAMNLAVSYLGARRGITRGIRTTESLWLEWGAARRGALWGMLIGILGVISPYKDGRYGAAFVWWLGIVGACAIFSGFRPRVVKGKTAPNQGIMLTWRTALRASRLAIPLVAIILVAHLIALLIGDGHEPRYIAIQTVGALVYFTLIIVTWFGGLEVGKHAVLRGVIGSTRQGPWSFSRLLNEAGARNLMRRAGGGYLFVHRFLQEHFAKMDLPPPARYEVRTDQGGAFSASTVVVFLLAMIGAIVLMIGLYSQAVAAVVSGAVLVALALQWLVIRSAVSSALRDQDDTDDLA